MKELKILQWNTGGLLSRHAEISNFTRDFDVMLLQKTFLTPKKKLCPVGSDLEDTLEDHHFHILNEKHQLTTPRTEINPRPSI